MKKYAVGLDFGTLSGRCVLVDVSNGHEVATAVSEYAHAVMDETLPDGTPLLKVDTALQHPADYQDVLRTTIREVLNKADVRAEQIVGVGVDFTASTVMPLTAEGTPLCLLPEFKSNPHAYVKLWKHHAAQPEADAINRIAAERGETFLQRYGGKISSEWLFPKLWEILKEAPDIYARMDCFLEAADWIPFLLTGKRTRNASSNGFKAMWSKKDGYPSPEFFKALDPRLENVVAEKLKGDVLAVGSRAGTVSSRAAELTGLAEGTPVAVGHMDSTCSLLGAGISSPGVMLAIMGTSTCHVLMGETEAYVPGSTGRVEGGVNPVGTGYEAGQCCVGDHFQWLVDNCVPESALADAHRNGMSIHEWLTFKAAEKLPGESGILALDWWNGNRSVLVDGRLSGVFVGCTLQTRAEDLYRALIEATAFGTRKIIETFVTHGVPVHRLVITGGIARKNPFIMQVYADVTGRDVHVAGSTQNPALSSAIWGALTAGKALGGYDDLTEAVTAMANPGDRVYKPEPEAVAVYDRLYREYETLHDYFGRGANDVMKGLKELTEQQKKKRLA